MLTRAQLTSVFPDALQADIDAFISFGEKALKDAGLLDGLNRLPFFLAQLGHESNGLTHREENLNYSASRLMEIWPNRFPTLAVAQQYDHDPEKLANFVYGGRLGNVNPGDGFRYRGRGYIQLTGRETYREVGKIAGLDLEGHPELAADPQQAVKIACAFWSWKKVNTACDAGDFTAVTQKINGGTNGLPDRLQWLNKVKAVVATPATTTTKPDTTKPATTTKPAATTTPQQPETMANDAVLQAQKKLSRLGYYKGVFDGIYNQVMRAALWSFQKDEDLPQTGRLDAKTREELNV